MLQPKRSERRPALSAVTVLAVSLLAAGCTYTTVRLAPSVPPNAQASVVLAADGTLLTTLHAGENRKEISLSEVPRHVQDAVVAIEDRRFWTHRGIDLRAILRAARTNLDEGAVVEGGSTITQQFVKNAMLAADRTLDRKIEEATLSIQVEREYSKEEILEYYLNTVYFGAGAYGIEAAAMVYLGKSASELTVAEGALIAGLIKAPSTYDPFVNGSGALARRQAVLQAMTDEGFLTPAEARRYSSSDIELIAPDPDQTYPAAYFVEEVKRFMLDHPAFGRTRDERIRTLFTGGLTIETTLDVAAQGEAEHAIELVLSDATDPSASVVTIDHGNGYVLAMVGGRDFFDGGPQSKFNLATQARRPSGSSFKPLVLAAAIEEGIPISQVYPAPALIEIAITSGVWEVENYGGSVGGNVNLTEAMVRSYNTVYAQLVMDVGPADAVAMATRLGVESHLLAVPSAVLGANDVSPLDMATAYGTIANGGIRNPVTYVTRVLGPDGEVLYQHEPSPVRSISRGTANQITDTLQQVVSRGTGVNARIGRPAAGKTGTGQNWGDAWFVGYTPDLVTSVLIGYPEGQISMVPPTTRIRVTGGTWPAQIWQLFMTAVLAETPISQFVSPDDDEVVEVAEPTEIDGDSVEETLQGTLIQDVVGMPAQLATEILTRAGFVVLAESVPDDDYPPDIVAAQGPPGESLARSGSEVTLFVANGLAVRRVPSVLGLDDLAAAAVLAEAGYEVDFVTEAEDDPEVAQARAGRVWKADPGSFTALETHSTVTIWINPT